jgi:hypothetical protein
VARMLFVRLLIIYRTANVCQDIKAIPTDSV